MRFVLLVSYSDHIYFLFMIIVHYMESKTWLLYFQMMKDEKLKMSAYLFFRINWNMAFYLCL